MRVLVVERDPAAAPSIAEMVRSFGYSVETARDVPSAWRQIEQTQAPIAVTEWHINGQDGLELCRRIRSSERPSYTYVIVLTGRDDREHLVEVVTAGADDFIAKPFDPEELRVRLLAAERIANLESDLRRANEDLRVKNKQLRRNSRTDSLMQIGNRAAFEDVIERVHRRASADGSEYGLVMCDLDHFKCYNDTFGHQAGDEILQRVARTIKLTVRATDWAFRYGGEELALLLEGHDLESARGVAERVRQRVAALQFELEDAEMPFRVTVSCGVAAFPGWCGVEAQWRDLVKAADQALYEAKRAGRNRTAVCRDGRPETLERPPEPPADSAALELIHAASTR